jgi:hypothetical protein
MFGLSAGFRGRRFLLSVPIVIYAAFCIYGTLSLTTQPQIRYAFILGCLLVPFFGLGLAQLARYWNVQERAVIAFALAVALIVQVASAMATLWQLGVLTRQLTGTSLVQRNPFATRRALHAAIANGTPGDTLVVGASVRSSYAALGEPFRNGLIQAKMMTVYRTTNLVMTHREYTDTLRRELASSRFVMVDIGGYEMGFVDGLRVDPIGSQVTPATTRLSWGGHDLVVVGRFGKLALLKRVTGEEGGKA